MLVILPTAFYLSGTRWGTSGIAAIWILVYPLLLIPMFARTFRRLGISVRDYTATVAPTLFSAALMVLVVLGVRAVAPGEWSLSSRFALQIVSGAAAFLLAMLFIQRRRLGVLAD